MKFVLYFISIALVLTFIVSYTIKIDTGLYCSESPVVRWKFAIYTGESDAETGCHFSKMHGTGMLEYFGFKKITCYSEDIHSINNEDSNKNNLQDSLPEISKVMPNGFVREFSADS